MQLKKKNRKAGKQALIDAGIPMCPLCHRSLLAEGAPCKFRKCPSNRKRREENEQDTDNNQKIYPDNWKDEE